jgi:hypothetical protein
MANDPRFRKWGSTPVRTEKSEEHVGDRLMEALGFTVWRMSQPRATKQSAGLPDRFYTHPAKGIAVFWEAKRPGGKQREAQKAFQSDVEACRIAYVVGPSDVLLAWCVAKNLCTASAVRP